LRRIADELRTTALRAAHSLEAIGKSDTIMRLQDGWIESIVDV
jgi:hypothetical protein